MLTRASRLVRPAIVTMLVLSATLAHAAGYPERPVRLIVSVGAGGIIDTLSRTVAKRLQERLGQPFVVENRPGAGSNIAGVALATAKPDGYTLMVALDGLLTVNPGLYADMPFDPLKQFTPIGLLAGHGFRVLVAANDFPGDTVAAVIAYGKKHPGKLDFASGGVGSPGHIYGELFQHDAGIRMQHIPFRSNPAAVLEVLAGRIPLMFSNPAGALPNLQAGKWKAIAIAGPDRSPLFPGLPTIAEAGLPQFTPGTYSFVLLGPAGLPSEIVDLLAAELSAITTEPAYRRQLEQAGMGPQVIAPAQLRQLLQAGHDFWTPRVRQLGIRSE
ncbi:MAG: Bug family tripartite tricarboxylate transporter substrate binding protein [Lautropia sp.]